MIYITKADGEKEPFDVNKLEHSLTRAGASVSISNQIVDIITREIRDGMQTEEIYRRAYELLRQKEKQPVAARYSIKRAVFELGPSGFPFERFVAEILKSQGWKTRTNMVLKGRCTTHEVDVVAEMGPIKIGVEVKFHNTHGIKTDVKDALYVNARFEDLKSTHDTDSKIEEGWLVTNTQFTKNAIHYGRCTGLTMLGWDYPRNHGLHALIETGRVHPITALTTLSEKEKRHLLDKNIVLCRSVEHGKHLLEEHGLRPSKISNVIEEARGLCSMPFATEHIEKQELTPTQ